MSFPFVHIQSGNTCKNIRCHKKVFFQQITIVEFIFTQNIDSAKHLIADAYSLRPARGTMEAPSKWLQLHPSRLMRRMCCKSTLVSLRATPAGLYEYHHAVDEALFVAQVLAADNEPCRHGVVLANRLQHLECLQRHDGTVPIEAGLRTSRSLHRFTRSSHDYG